jgi:YjjI family glycine radical enzyme
VPNLTLKYDPAITPLGFALDAVASALETAKPSFANHAMFLKDFKKIGFNDYAIASCYNGLPKGGGACTLVRMNLAKLALFAKSIEDFLQNTLPDAVHHQLLYMDKRVSFLLDESAFFTSSFLVAEKLIHKERFTAMFGIVGLAECVNHLLPNKKFGHDEDSEELGLSIIKSLYDLVNKHKNKQLQANNGSYMLHAQVGIDSDLDSSPGCRIPIGQEPELHEHLIRSAPYHAYFISGIGDVFAFETTAKSNPQYILDIINGSFKQGMRYFSAYSSDSDLVRITGYLVKKSEMEKLKKGGVSMHDTTLLGLNAAENCHVLDRKTH